MSRLFFTFTIVRCTDAINDYIECAINDVTDCCGSNIKCEMRTAAKMLASNSGKFDGGTSRLEERERVKIAQSQQQQPV